MTFFRIRNLRGGRKFVSDGYKKIVFSRKKKNREITHVNSETVTAFMRQVHAQGRQTPITERGQRHKVLPLAKKQLPFDSKG